MSSRVGVNLRASAYLHQGDRKYMEDEFQVAYQRTHDKKDIEYAFFGIFDGHGGKEAAHFAKDNLMDNIVSQRLFWSDNDEDVLCAIKEGFLQTHLAMWKVLDQWPRTASGWPSTSGTTASIAFIRRQKIYIGHVGDSGIVLGYEDDNCDWVGESLTRDHKPESVMEMSRITESGGKVIAKSGVPRVVWNRPKSGHQGPVRRSTPMDEIPFLAVARSLGDLWSYNAINNQFVVSPEPDVCVIDIDINHHRCLVFGTDGLWNALSPTTAVNIAYCTEKNNEKHYLGIPMMCGTQRLWINPSRSIVSGALQRYHRVGLRADNTSAVTVYLDPPGRPKREVLLQQLSMEKGSPKSVGEKSPKKVNKEVTVQVHVYNQKQSGEGNRGMFRIQERIPPDWQSRNDNASSPLEDSCKHISDGFQNALPIQPNEDNQASGVKSHSESKNGTSPCSECGCVNHTSTTTPGHTLPHHNKVDSVDELNRKVLSNIFSNKLETVKSSKPDDIQIPVVSSSTVNAEKTKEEKASTLKPKTVDLATLSEKKKRRTRSCLSLPLIEKNGPTIKERTNRHSISSFENDASNRILKNVNRSSVLKMMQSPKYISHKRKRSKELLDEERNSKSLRVHTRSHTWSHKSMVTRSQGNSKKSPDKTKS